MRPALTMTVVPEERQALLEVACRSVAGVLGGGEMSIPDPAEFPAGLRRHAATFVTLEDGDRLLGCIGALEPRRPLVIDVAQNAVAAAFADPRVPPLTHGEYATMSIKVSVLGHMEPVEADGYAELRSSIVAGEDGLVVQAGRHRGTLLPSVWPKVSGTTEFLEILWRKAGLPSGAWPDHLRVERYRTVEFGDPGPRPPVPSA